jgi:hypothetical protein
MKPKKKQSQQILARKPRQPKDRRITGYVEKNQIYWYAKGKPHVGVLRPAGFITKQEIVIEPDKPPSVIHSNPKAPLVKELFKKLHLVRCNEEQRHLIIRGNLEVSNIKLCDDPEMARDDIDYFAEVGEMEKVKQ